MHIIEIQNAGLNNTGFYQCSASNEEYLEIESRAYLSMAGKIVMLIFIFEFNNNCDNMYVAIIQLYRSKKYGIMISFTKES